MKHHLYHGFRRGDVVLQYPFLRHAHGTHTIESNAIGKLSIENIGAQLFFCKLGITADKVFQHVAPEGILGRIFIGTLVEQDLLLHFVQPGSCRSDRRDVRAIGVCAEHPRHKVVLVFEMIVKGRTFDVCRLADLRDADLVYGFVLHDLPHLICDPHLCDFSHEYRPLPILTKMQKRKNIFRNYISVCGNGQDVPVKYAHENNERGRRRAASVLKGWIDMSFLELAKNRYSERYYDLRPIEQEKLDKILEAGRVVPTVCNYKPQHFYL